MFTLVFTTFLLKFLPVAISWYLHLLRSVHRQIQSMCRHWNQDILGIMRGAQSVLNAMLKHQEMQCNQIWKTSSMRNVVEEACNSLDRRTGQISSGSIQVSTYSYRCIVCWNSNLYQSFEAVLLSVNYFHFVIMRNTRLSMGSRVIFRHWYLGHYHNQLPGENRIPLYWLFQRTST